MLEKLTSLDQLSLANKTPVSWLHEICTRNNITPKYDLLQVEGAVHEPIFQYRLTIEYNNATFEETGTGKSKKEAKHSAARGMLATMEIAPHVLFTMNEQTKSTTTISTTSSPSTSAAAAAAAGAGGSSRALGIQLSGGAGGHGAGGCGGSHNDSMEDPADASTGNPVGILQELCMKMKYPPPTYGVDSEEGLPHERQFAVACTVGDQFIQVGKGKSKKLAKRRAAHMMAEYLRNLPLEVVNSMIFEEDDDKIIEKIHSSRPRSAATHAGSSSSSSGSGGTSRKGRGGRHQQQQQPRQGRAGAALLATTQEMKQYLDMSGEIIDKLNDEEAMAMSTTSAGVVDPIEFVNQLGEEQNFKAMYVDLEERSAAGKFECIVQITLDPPAVLMGEGDTVEEARVEAAKDVIHLFSKIRLLKKDKKKTEGGEKATLTTVDGGGGDSDGPAASVVNPPTSASTST